MDSLAPMYGTLKIIAIKEIELRPPDLKIDSKVHAALDIEVFGNSYMRVGKDYHLHSYLVP